MHSVVRNKRDKIIEICRKRNILSLTLFGSAAGNQFNPESSDLDFIVEFEKMKPKDHAQQYFGFIEDMEHLFQRPVDVIESKGIKNPYFQRSVDESKELIYART